MHPKPTTVICLIFILGLSFALGHLNGYNMGYNEGIQQGRNMVRKEAVAIGVAEYEYSDTQEDIYGNSRLKFKWKRLKKD